MKKTTNKERKKVVKPKEESQDQSVKVKEIKESYQDMYDQIIFKQKNIMSQRVTNDLTPSKLQEAIILSEILGKPVSKRKDRRTLSRR